MARLTPAIEETIRAYAGRDGDADTLALLEELDAVRAERDDALARESRTNDNFYENLKRCNRAEATLAAIRGAIGQLLADMKSGPLDDCSYGGGCVAYGVEGRLLALLDAALKEQQ